MTRFPTLYVGEDDYILDLDLAEQLGLADPIRIRDRLIERHKDRLLAEGELIQIEVQSASRNGKTKAYYLSFLQMIVVCRISRAPNAHNLRCRNDEIWIGEMNRRRREEECSAKPQLSARRSESGQPARRPKKQS